jgi:hypothetical protein
MERNTTPQVGCEDGDPIAARGHNAIAGNIKQETKAAFSLQIEEFHEQ